MTTLFRAVPIESAEQAKALPEDAILVSANLDGRVIDARLRRESYVSSAYFSGSWVLTALVPIEVEVEQIRETRGRRREKTVYVTPWEESR